MASRPELWARAAAACGSVDEFARVFDGPADTLLPQLRPPTASAVIHGSTQELLDALQNAISRVVVVGPGTDLDDLEGDALLQAAALVERPALFIKDGSFVAPDSRWRVLDRYRAALELAIAAVGRIEYTRRTGEVQLGTGFLIAPNLIMTNRHVVEDLARFNGSSWVVKPGLRPRIDFRQEEMSSAEDQHEIQEVRYVSGDRDAAVLSIAPFTDDGRASPAPVRFSKDVRARKDRLVAAIGYPDGGKGAEATLERAMFADRFGVKRIQPGRILWSRSPVFAHDCSSTVGSSGSCIVTISNGSAVGLHYRGVAGVENLAVVLEGVARQAPELTQSLNPRV
ncbi:V8-like Glu-specific endopeptidase [Microbacterium trichothecenolyticum]|uniref:trypsin-like serine peptidase n=1 Tax=Microbacterium trichothecenolyticum TaxID=69370 RepID=UPI002855F9F1|nr:serine protease [Microbacterium trichothecenolyticum]MDR7113748.1 V8-like Glu-specific endopeptidase [Microbacterium trichothecenolyticum]